MAAIQPVRDAPIPDQAEIETAATHWLMTPFVIERSGSLELRGETGGDVGRAVAELAAWRIATADGPKRREISDPQRPFNAPELWHEYMREEIPPLFGETFNSGSWNSGIVKIRKGLVLLSL